MDQHAVAAYFHIELAQEVLAQQRIPVRAARIARAHAQAADHQGGHAHLLGHHHAAVALAIGGAKANRLAAVQACALGQRLGHADHAGARVHQEQHGLPVDGPFHAEMPVAVTRNGHRAIGLDLDAGRLQVHLHGPVQHAHDQQPEQQKTQHAAPGDGLDTGLGGRCRGSGRVGRIGRRRRGLEAHGNADGIDDGSTVAARRQSPILPAALPRHGQANSRYSGRLHHSPLLP